MQSNSGNLQRNYGGLSKFVDEIEARLLGGGCPVCAGGVTFRVVYGDEEPPAYREETQAGNCLNCGRPVQVRVKWPALT